MEEQQYTKIRYLCIVCVMAFGSCSSALQKFMFINDFFYPFFQCVLMFIGEFLNIFFVLINLQQKRLKIKHSNSLLSSGSSVLLTDLQKSFLEKLGKYIYCLAALLDFITAYIGAYCYHHLNPADYLSLTMLSTYYILLYRKFIQKRRLYRHQWLGLILFTIGMFCVVLNNTFYAKRNEGESKATYILLLLLQELFQSLQLILIEFFMWKNDANSSEVNSIKGITGLLICAIVYYPLQMYSHNTHYSDLLDPTFILARRDYIIILVLLYISDLILYNYFFIKLLKITEPIVTCTIDSSRILIVGTFFILFPLQTNIILPIFGGIFINLGLVLYNELVILPFWGFDKSAKISLEENRTIRKKRSENMNWIHKLDQLVEIQSKKKSKLVLSY